MRTILLVIFASSIILAPMNAQNRDIWNKTFWDLKGNVKQFTVISDIGKDIYEFNLSGNLISQSCYINNEIVSHSKYEYDNKIIV